MSTLTSDVTETEADLSQVLQKIRFLKQRGSYELAQTITSELLVKQSKHKSLLCLKSELHLEQGELSLAKMKAQQTFELDSNSEETLYLLSQVSMAQGDTSSALNYLEQLLMLNPSHQKAQFKKSTCLLIQEKWEQAWPLYSVHKTLAPNRERIFSTPVWQGEPLTQKTLLIYCDNEADTIQNIRYLSELQEKHPDSDILLLVQSDLFELVRKVTIMSPSVNVVEDIYTKVDASPEIDHYDYYTYISNLPAHFKTQADTIPWTKPYIAVDKQRFNALSTHFNNSKLKVGLVWRGDENTENNVLRSLALDDYGHLAQLSHIQYYSLQKGFYAYGSNRGLKWVDLIDLDPVTRDYSDIATSIAHLDLVITADSTLAHIAGAMGKPVWLLLDKGADWRWLTNTNKSKWYPNIKVFRQAEQGNWQTVVNQLREELKYLTPEELKGMSQFNSTEQIVEYKSQNQSHQALLSALYHQSKNRLRDAKRLYEQVLSLEPTHPYANAGLAMVYILEKNTDAARLSISKALEYNQTESSFYLISGNLNVALKQLEAGLERYQRALELNPYCPETNKNIATVLIHTKHVNEAQYYLRTVIRLKPNDVDALVQYGRVLIQFTQYKKAEQALIKASEVSPQSKPVWKELNQFYTFMGDAEKANICLAKLK